MDACAVTPRIVNFSNMLVGRIRGGLSYVTLVAMDFSSGITGQEQQIPQPSGLS